MLKKTERERILGRRRVGFLILALVGLGVLATSMVSAQILLCKTCFWDDDNCFVVADGFGFSTCGLRLVCNTVSFPNGDSSTFCFWKCKQSNPCVLPPG